MEKLPLVIARAAPYTILYSGGSSACSGIFFGGVAGLYKLHCEKVSVTKFADAVSLPLAVMLSIGRLGCLCEGCCEGEIITPCWYSIHFPHDMQGVERFPSQLVETLALAIISLILYIIEKRYRKRYNGAILFPVFLAMYGGLRLVADRYRVFQPDRGFYIGTSLSAAAFAVGIAWLIYTLKMGKNTEYKKSPDNRI